MIPHPVSSSTLIYPLFQTNKPTVENDFTQKHREWPPHLQHLVRDDQENISPAGRSNSDGDPLLSGDSSAKHSGEMIAFYCDYLTDHSLLQPPAPYWVKKSGLVAGLYCA